MFPSSSPVRRTRHLAYRFPVLFALLLLSSLFAAWAIREEILSPGRQEVRQTDPAALAYFQRIALEERERPLDVAPLGDFTPDIPGLGQRKGLIYTQAGFFNPRDNRAFDRLPADLRPAAVHAAPNGKGPGLGSGIGIIQISEEALRTRGMAAIEADIKALGVRILETRPDRALVVKGNEKALAGKALAELVKASFVEASLPYAPAFKIEPVTGKQMLADKVRSGKHELDIHVSAWDRSDVEGLLKDLKTGHGDTVTLLDDGETIRATVTVADLRKIARDERVRNIGEVPEYQLASAAFAEHPPTVMVGENENAGAAVPYWDAGADGGGCGNTGTGTGQGNTDTRNCSTAVPPTIVAILDNGASTDAATLAHDAAARSEADIASLIGGNQHRKIRDYQIVNDVSPMGSTCDGVLAGGQTHGNVIAGMLAGSAAALGFQFQKNNNPLIPGDVRLLNLDGVARGARLVIQDAGSASQCTVAEIMERGANVTPGVLATRMDAAYAAGARLHVMPFGIPNWGAGGTTSAGSYSADASALDRYLVNNLEYQVFVPVGNRGFSLSSGRDLIPDFFDGQTDCVPACTMDPGNPNQISPPATAKNVVSAGATGQDAWTAFGAFNEEENVTNFTSKGPATNAGLRSAPILVGVGNDRSPALGAPVPYGIYSVRSRDSNQGGAVEAEIDEQARGTSFGAASIASAATILEDYLHQGFYPTGDRVQGDRVAAVSGAAVKAMLAASANFAGRDIGYDARSTGMGTNDVQVATTRGSIVTISGVPTVLVNNQQGYGRVIVSQALPVVNWPDVSVPGDAALTGDTPERPALGLLIWDGIDPDGAGPDTPEPPISNSDTLHEHHFQVLGTQGQIRSCLAWPDPPGDLLVNDLDLELTDPNGRIYDGNVYDPLNQVVGQWSLGRTGGTDSGDRLNPIECVHLTGDPDGIPETADGQIVPGTWTLRVKRGAGGALPGQISQVTGPGEDANGNNRLDGGEDLDADSLLDKGGQVYAAVVAGPVLASKDGTNPARFGDYPASITRLDRIRYTCSDEAVVNLWDSDATSESLPEEVTIRVYGPSGALVDTESNLLFSGSGQVFTSLPVAVRLGTGSPATGTAGNGILEGDTGYILEVIHSDPTPGSRAAVARAPMDCEPAFLGGLLAAPGQRDAGDLIFGGCDGDSFFDAGEVVTYSVAVVNDSRLDDYTDVTAALSACAVPFAGDGTCATPSTVLTILDTPRNIGRLPAGQPAAVTFSIRVSPTPLAQGPRVYLRLGLSQTGSGKPLDRIAFSFSHAMGADRESLHYSTDHPAGSGPVTRDLDRSMVIEPSDRPGLTLGNPDETIRFSSLFSPLSGRPESAGAINNVICTGPGAPHAGCAAADEPYPALGNFTPGASDSNTNGILDRHVLTDTNPAGADRIPWNFDTGNGGWYAVRDASTILGSSGAVRPLWHWVKNGTCGFQTQSNSNCVIAGGTPGKVTVPGTCAIGGAACTTDRDCGVNGPCAGATCSALTPGSFTGGVWHTGSGVAGTCSGGGTPGAACYLDDDCSGGTCTGGADNPQCGNYGIAFSASTVRRAEFLLDYLISPVLEKVNQGDDAAGFPFTMEFQRLAFNDTVQFRYNEPTLYVSLDNDIDSDNPVALIRAGNGPRGDGTAYFIAKEKGPIDSYYSQNYYNQRTFGPRTDPDGSLTHCSVTTATACTLDSNCPGGEVCGKLTGDESGFSGFDRSTTNAYAVTPIIPTAPRALRPFPGPGEAHVGDDTVAGPSRAMDFGLVDYEDGGLHLFVPGDAGSRFQIGLAFLYVETPASQAGAPDGDFGLAIDDVVFEWDETHPVAESQSSCSRIGTGRCSGGTNDGNACSTSAECTGGGTCLPAIAAGCRCATVSVDRTNLYDCNETVTVTVQDSRYASDAVAPCVAGNPAVPDTVPLRAWSNSEPFPGETLILAETGNATGFFTGQVPVSGLHGSAGTVFVNPASDTSLFFAYEDGQCDASRNLLAGQSDFYNMDGDGIQAAAGRDGICGTEDDLPSFFGPDGICGYNPSTGSIDDTGDNCALVYNSLQGDDDGDRVGGATSGGVYSGCDNCPFVYNPVQTDADQDGMGDACEYGDVDADSVVNELDNCPDVYNPSQTPGSGGRGVACDSASADADADTVIDRNDNCVLTPNLSQTDSDLASIPPPVQPLGDACDGDCLGTCAGGVNAGKACRWDSTNAYGFPDACPGGTCGAVVCSALEDDPDADGAKDGQDNCPATPNPTTVPGSNPPVQADGNFNGIGDACDPAGNFDENRDGLPDDVAAGPFYALAVSCREVSLAKIVILAPTFRDLADKGDCPGGPTVQACAGGASVGRACASNDECPGSTCATVSDACGDGDSFGDPGERVRIALHLQNLTGKGLTGVTLALVTSDPDVQCVRDAVITIPDFPDGAFIDTRTLAPPDDPAQPGDGQFFEMTIAPTATTTNPLRPSRAEMGLALYSNEAGGVEGTTPFFLLLDLDIAPGAVITPTAARCDGDLAPSQAGLLCPGGDQDCGYVTGACKPGLIYEGFESPGPNPGVPKPTGGLPQNNDFSSTIGFIERNAYSDSDTTVVGKGCFGFGCEFGPCVPEAVCNIDPDLDTDWHFEVSGTAPTPKAFHGNKSAHWGRHTTTSRSGDTTPLREIEAFDTNPINLTIFPGTTDLFLSFWHIVSFADDNRVGFQVGQAGDRGDVQIAFDTNPDPGVDNFGRWQKLIPYQNAAEHTTQVFSWFGYCEYTPTDGARAESPDVYGETMCFPDLIWSHSGNVVGTDLHSIFQAEGPGHLGSAGDGVWVQTRFDLREYMGQRVKIRWIAQGWDFGNGWDSYLEPPGGGNPFDIGYGDDGWWIDSIQITGALTSPVPPVLETGTIPLTGQCPATAAESCDESLGAAGFEVDFRLYDADGDGVVIRGETLLLDASRTANPGGCAGGIPQYRFSREDGAGTTVLQDWSTATSLRLGNTADGDLYRVEARCSSDFSCTTPPTGPPEGAVSGGCRVFAGFVPSPVEPAVGFSLSAGSSDMVMTQPNFLLTGPGTPPHLALPPSTYGHAFLRTDALSVGDGATDGGLSGSCAGVQCAISEIFRNVIVGGSGSCPLLATQHPCNAPSPAILTWTDGTAPPAGTLYYYLGDVFTTPSGILKVFGNAGASLTDAGPMDRTAHGTCPGPVTLP